MAKKKNNEESASKPAETNTTPAGTEAPAKKAWKDMTKAEQIAAQNDWTISYGYAPESEVKADIEQKKGYKAILEINMRKFFREGQLYDANGRFRDANRDDCNQGIVYHTDTGEIKCKTIIGKEIQVLNEATGKKEPKIVIVTKTSTMFQEEREAYRQTQIDRGDDPTKIKDVADDYGKDIRARICDLMLLTLFRKLGHLKNEMPTVKQLNALLKPHWVTGKKSGKKRINIERKFHSKFYKSSEDNKAENALIEAAQAEQAATGWIEE